MELGEKLRNARLEAGLTQRALCGNQITRNMLSQIENGTARPSMATLRYLAEKLGKNVSFFLEETAVVSPNQEVMERARMLYDGADYASAAAELEHYREPDPVYDREKRILWVMVCLERARQALAQGREPYARELLEKAAIRTAYCWEELERQRLLLLGSIPGEQVCARLPSLDRELLLRSEDALKSGDTQRAEALLDAAENQTSPRWSFLKGEVLYHRGEYSGAAECYHRAEQLYPDKTAQRLEVCCRELGDYRQAYEYALKQRK